MKRSDSDVSTVFADEASGGRSGIQSIEVGTRVLAVLVAAPGPMPLSALAAAAGMSMSKAHKYLASFMRVGLVRQSATSGLYDLGRFALEVGLAAMSRLDVIESGNPVMRALSARTGETVSLTVWNHRGATIVRLVENSRPVAVTVRLGAVLDVLTSSNGRIFLTWLDRMATAHAVERELSDANGAARRAEIRTLDDVEALIGRVRSRGLAEVQGLVVPGIFGLSAPVFGSTGVVASLTIIGSVGSVDTCDTAPVTIALREASRALTAELGGSRFLESQGKGLP